MTLGRKTPKNKVDWFYVSTQLGGKINQNQQWKWKLYAVWGFGMWFGALQDWDCEQVPWILERIEKGLIHYHAKWKKKKRTKKKMKKNSVFRVCVCELLNGRGLNRRMSTNYGAKSAFITERENEKDISIHHRERQRRMVIYFFLCLWTHIYIPMLVQEFKSAKAIKQVVKWETTTLAVGTSHYN